MLRKVFRPWGDEVSGKYRILHKEKLCDLYMSSSIAKAVKWTTMGWTCSSYKEHIPSLRGEHLGKHMLGSQRTLEDNVKLNLQEVSYKNGRWMELALKHV